jgi:hypothetical protein
MPAGRYSIFPLRNVGDLSPGQAEIPAHLQGFEIPPRAQQTPEARGALHKAEIKKRWPLIKAANIKGE